MIEPNDQTFPLGVSRVGRAKATAPRPMMVTRNSLPARPVRVTVGSLIPLSRPRAVILVVMLNMVGICAVLWFWMGLFTYGGELDRLSPYLTFEAETTRRIVGILQWALPVVMVFIAILVAGLWALRSWARKTFIGLYALGVIGSILSFNVISILLAILFIVLLTRPNVVEAFAQEEINRRRLTRPVGAMVGSPRS